ncbi:MAG: anaerobic glycerol-3-phosphate dehydrogenase subunit C [Anaerolineae bacterium]
MKQNLTDLEQELAKRVEGEVRFDKYSRILYSTDASIYQIEPIGVVIPRHKDDIVAVIQFAHQHGLPVLPRGGGSSLAGQTVGEAIIIDLSRYMNRVLAVNQEEHWVRVQPGIPLDNLNACLKPYGLMYGPDPASGNRATMGGIIGNNSTGAHSILYGMTVDHVEELEVVLSNGEEARLNELSEEEWGRKLQGDRLESDIYRAVQRIVSENQAEILARYPKIMRRSGGYNLDSFIRPGARNLAKMVVGSEGTLATVTEARLNLVPRPVMTALDIVHFDTLIEAMEATTEILQCHPAAVELIDKMILNLTKGTLEYARRMTFVEGDPTALLLVQFYGQSSAELEAKIEKLEAHLRKRRMGTAFVRVHDPQEQADIWQVRKAGLALLLGIKGDKKPIAFIEDTAVAPEQLPTYISQVQRILAEHNTTAGYYAHASAGCIHIRPLINLKEITEVTRMHSIARAVSDLVLEFGGVMSGEHGDGLARSQWNEKMFGSQLYQAFREVKGAFDPQGIMNPGKIVDAPAMTENLRYGQGYKAISIATRFDFSPEGGFDRAIEMCNGAGICRKTLEGTMCPSYMVTGEEEHSTRGRANILRAVISGHLPLAELSSKRLYQVMDLCLQCKGCKAECPSNVDMGKLKAEFLAGYHDQHDLPLRSWLFGHIADLNRIGCALAPLSNWVVRSGVTRWAMAQFLGVDRRRSLPPFTRPTFPRWFQARNGIDKGARRGKVVLFHDTFMTYNYPVIGRAAVQLLEQAGFEVILPQKRCCGRPLISKGMLDQARANAAYNVAQLAPYAEQGYPIVGCEPSCVLTIRDEYLALLDDQRAQLVADHTYTIEEFLVELRHKGELDLAFNSHPRKIILHGHCHQKALVGLGPTQEMLSWPPGYEVEVLDSGCCGMAGAFGYETEHYELSMAIGGRRLFPAIEAQGEEVVIVTTGASCRQQIEQGTGRTALHPVEVLLDALQKS